MSSLRTHALHPVIRPPPDLPYDQESPDVLPIPSHTASLPPNESYCSFALLRNPHAYSFATPHSQLMYFISREIYEIDITFREELLKGRRRSYSSHFEEIQNGAEDSQLDGEDSEDHASNYVPLDEDEIPENEPNSPGADEQTATTSPPFLASYRSINTVPGHEYLDNMETIMAQTPHAIYLIHKIHGNLQCSSFNFETRKWHDVCNFRVISSIFRCASCQDERDTYRVWICEGLAVLWIDIPREVHPDESTDREIHALRIQKNEVIEDRTGIMGCALEQYKGRLYLFGGNDSLTKQCPVFKLDLFETDADTDDVVHEENDHFTDEELKNKIWHWRLLNPRGSAPPNGYCTTSARRNHHVYVFGTYSSGVRHLYRFDLELLMWQKFKLHGVFCPSPRYDCSLIISGDYLVIAGGKMHGGSNHFARDCYFVELPDRINPVQRDRLWQMRQDALLCDVWIETIDDER